MTVKGLEKWIAQEAKAEKALRAAARKGKRERKELLALEEELPKVETPAAPPKPEPKPIPHYVFETPRLPQTLDTSIATSLYATPQYAVSAPSVPISIEPLPVSQPRPRKIKAPKSLSPQPRTPKEEENSWEDWLLIGAVMFATAVLSLYAIKRPQPERKEVKGFA